MTPQERVYQALKDIRMNQVNAHASAEQKWIVEHLNEDDLKKMIPNLSVISLHTLSALETNPKTGIELANELKVTRGGISRASKKLINYDLISTEKKENNKKNIYYVLTKTGKKVAQVHDKLHQTIQDNMNTKLKEKYSDDDLNKIADFLNDINKYEKELN